MTLRVQAPSRSLIDPFPSSGSHDVTYEFLENPNSNRDYDMKQSDYNDVAGQVGNMIVDENGTNACLAVYDENDSVPVIQGGLNIDGGASSEDFGQDGCLTNYR